MQQEEDTRNRRISERAYALWVQEGQPHGRDREHWLAAEHEIAATERASPGRFRAGRTRSRKTANLEA